MAITPAADVGIPPTAEPLSTPPETLPHCPYCSSLTGKTGGRAHDVFLLLPRIFGYRRWSGRGEGGVHYGVRHPQPGLFRRIGRQLGRGITRSKKPLATDEITATSGGGSGKSADSSRRPTPRRAASRTSGPL